MNDEDNKKALSSPGFANNNIIFEQISNEVNGSNYLVWDRIERNFQLRDDVWRNYQIDNTDYFPLEKIPWPKITGYESFKSTEELYLDIRAFFVEHLDVANELLYDVYACFVLASWRVEDFKVIPYLFFLGPLSSGKTRALECFHLLCYRAILSASISAASVFRVLEAWHPTLLLDETEIYNRENMIEVLALLNTGYRKGQCAIRIEQGKQGCLQIGMFDTFGFKILAGTEELANTLQSRCIITAMSRAVNSVKLFVDEEKAQSLRNKLLNYRFQNLGNINDATPAEFAKTNGIFRNSRVIELFISLFQVAPNDEVKTRLLNCMKRITQSRLDEEQASIEARVFEAVAKSEQQIENGKISTQSITETFNEGLPENDKVTSRFIGRKIAALGFEKCRVGSKGQNGFYWDIKLVERLKDRYCSFGLKLTTESPETSETTSIVDKPSLTNLLNPEVTEVNSSVKGQPKLSDLPSDTVISEVSEQTDLLKENTPTIREVIEYTRPKLSSVFSEEKLLIKIMEMKVSKEHAKKYFEFFKEKSMIAQDDLGSWYWVRGGI